MFRASVIAQIRIIAVLVAWGDSTGAEPPGIGPWDEVLPPKRGCISYSVWNLKNILYQGKYYM